MKAHNWHRTIIAIVVCSTAIGTYWYNTHPDKSEHYDIIQVKQGDGYLTETQCRSIERGNKMSSLREKFGVPARTEGINDYSWGYPLREDNDRSCTVGFSDWFGPIRKGERVDYVTLELV